MITAKKINYQLELEKINKMLNSENLSFEDQQNQILYGIEDNEGIFGISQITIIEDMGVLDYIIIDKSKRGENFGDSLLRAIFNYCNTLNIREIYYFGKNDYLEKKGLENLKTQKFNKEIKFLNQEKNMLFCNLKDFFNKGCGNH